LQHQFWIDYHNIYLSLDSCYHGGKKKIGACDRLDGRI